MRNTEPSRAVGARSDLGEVGVAHNEIPSLDPGSYDLITPCTGRLLARAADLSGVTVSDRPDGGAMRRAAVAAIASGRAAGSEVRGPPPWGGSMDRHSRLLGAALLGAAWLLGAMSIVSDGRAS